MSGLKPFLGRELELLPSHRELLEMSNGVIDLCTYLLQKGPVLKDGDAARLGDAEDVHIRHARSQYSGTVPVIQVDRMRSNGAGACHG